MSKHREVVVWESKDGTWNVGAWNYEEPPLTLQDNNYDDEWDVEYTYDGFWFTQTGLRSEQEAIDFYGRYNPNPGGHETCPYKGNSARVKQLDQYAWAAKHPEEAQKAREKEERLKASRYARDLSKTLSETLKPAEGMFLEAKVKLDDQNYTILGSSVYVKGAATLKGNWLTIEGKPVWNVKTQKVHPRVHTLGKPVQVGGYRSRW